jgi:hypothetical protein
VEFDEAAAPGKVRPEDVWLQPGETKTAKRMGTQYNFMDF